MLRQINILRGFLLLVFVVCGGPLASAGTVYFEVYTQRGAPLTAAQQWSRILADAGAANVTLRSAQAGDRSEIITRGAGQAAIYTVRGVLDAGNTLQVPGNRFSATETRKLADWIRTLAEEGPEIAEAAERPAFGLDSRRMQDVRDDFARRLTGSTLDREPRFVIESIRQQLRWPVVIDPRATAALNQAAPVMNELQGMACGTALAAVAQPLGLAVLPRRDAAGGVEYVLGPAAGAAESWPIGYLPEGLPRDTAPTLMEMVPVEIEDVALTEALDAIGERVQLPFLYDQAALIRQRISPEDIQVSLPSKRTTYAQILQGLLRQGALRYELRQDDAGEAFLWITSSRR